MTGLIDSEEIKVSPRIGKKLLAMERNIDNMPTHRVIGYLLNRHKVGLLIVWGVSYPTVQLLLYFGVI